jgi:hypothetical protein
MILPIKNNPTGGMNKDLDRLYVGQGDYLDALNISHISDTGGKTQSVQPVLGNEYAFGIEKAVIQNKKYLIKISDLTPDNFNYTLLNITATSFMSGTSYLSITSTYGDWTGFTAEIDSWLNGSYYPGGFNVSINGGLTEITIEILNNVEATMFTSKSPFFVLPANFSPFPIYCIAENIYPCLTGKMNIIGSFDLNGDLFIWSCVDRNFTLPSVTFAVDLGLSLFSITTSEPHGLQVNDNIIGSLIFSSTSPQSGIYVVTAVTDAYTFTVFTVQGATSSGSFVSGTISYIDENVSEIGVAQKDYNKGVGQDKWTYTTLVRSKQLNFRITHQVDTYCEVNNCIPSLYWTDNLNKPKVLYYYGQQYLLNGFILGFNPDAIYDYDTIGIESNLVLGSPNIKMTVTQDLGGQLLGYARQYVVRFSTNALDYTEWSYVSNLIPMTKESESTDWRAWAFQVYPTRTTGKKNIIKIEGINFAIFSYIQLGVIEYPGTVNSLAVNGYIAKTVELAGNPGDSLTLEHTGFETQLINLDITTIPQVFAQFDKALNISALNNRLILSNLTVNAEYDLTAWAKTIHYDLNIKTLPAFGKYDYSSVPGGSTTAKEYQIADNQSLYTGYMRNETYRFGIQVHYKGGQWSSAFVIDDITFDKTIHNASQQDSALATFDLTVGTTLSGYPEFINVAHPSFTSIDLNYVLPDGKVLSQLIDGFRIVRMDCIPEVLFTGTAFMSKEDTVSVYYSQEDFVAGGTYTPTNPTEETRRANICSPDYILGLSRFSPISSDVLKNIGAGSLIDMYSFGTAAPEEYNIYSFDGEFNNSSDFTDISLDDVQITPGAKLLSDGVYYSVLGGTTTLQNGKIVSSATNLGYRNFQVAVAVLTDTTTPLTNGASTNNDTGFYYVQYFRANPNKYDEVLTPQYKTTGQTVCDLSNHTTASSYDVFGGDTFVQRTYFFNYIGRKDKNQIPTPDQEAYQKFALGFYSENRGNLQYRYGEHDDFNVDNYATFFPGIKNNFEGNLFSYTNGSLGYIVDENIYALANSPKQQIVSYVEYDPKQVALCLGTRIFYSVPKVRNGNQDGYRVFLPLNFKDLNPSFGEIINTDIGNGELLTWQQQYFERQYFSNSGTLLATGGQNLLVGDGSILSREPQYITKFGTKFKWAVVKGVSKGGNDTFYWINDDFKKIVRFGYDGTVALSDIQGVKAFIDNNLTYAQYFLSPASGYGLHGVWHDYKSEAIWTLRSYKKQLVWDAETEYLQGQYVTVDGDENTIGYEEYPQVYVALQNSTNNYPPSTLYPYWEKVPLSNTEVYQNFTLAYNEIKNKFTTFYTYKPKIYLQWKNTFLSPCPTANNVETEFFENVYEHNLGDISGWYCVNLGLAGSYVSSEYNSQTDATTLVFSGTSFLTTFNLGNGNFYSILGADGTMYEVLYVLNDETIVVQGNCVSLEGEIEYRYCNAEYPYIEMVTNYEPNDYKVFLASQFNCEETPQKIEYRGQNYVTDTDSYTDSERYELEKREGYWYTPIYNDVTGSSDGQTKTEDTSRMFGKYLRTKFIFKLFKNNKLFNFITKLTLNSRSYKK